VRIAAITALGTVSPALAAKTAADLIDDPDDDLAIAAITVLGSIQRPDAQGFSSARTLDATRHCS
jgi:hypothetical protein